MSVRLLKFLFPFLQLAINKQNIFHFGLKIRGPARPPPPPPSRVFNFLLHYVSYLPKSYLWTKKMKGIYFSTLATKSGFLLNFSWPSLLNILDSVFCLSQTTTKFVLLTILNHIIFIPYFVNGLGFFSSGIANYFFFSNSAKTNWQTDFRHRFLCELITAPFLFVLRARINFLTLLKHCSLCSLLQRP